MADCKGFNLFRLLLREECFDVRNLKSSESVEDLVLNYDIHRTRIEEFSDSDQKNLKIVLKQFCKDRKISYKQGMNEILAPFIIMVDQGLSLEQAYNCFTSFIDKVIPTIFTESANESLAGLFKITRMLLRYLLPGLSLFFESNQILPEFYMTSWVITVFSSKIPDFSHVFLLWESLIRSGHPANITLLCIALLSIHQTPLQQESPGSVLVYLSSISLSSEESIYSLIQVFNELLRSLPESITNFLTAFNMLNSEAMTYKLDSLNIFSYCCILPEEYLKSLYPEAFFNIINTKSFVLIDIRNEVEINCGYFPNSVLFPAENLEKNEKIEVLIKDFDGVKGFSHFVVMGFDSKVKHNAILLVQRLVQTGFGLVSIALGGFAEAHRIALAKGLALKKHRTHECFACVGGKKSPKKFVDYLWPGRRRVKSYENFDRNLDYLDYTSWMKLM